jgi:hypothetical protein
MLSRTCINNLSIVWSWGEFILKVCNKYLQIYAVFNINTVSLQWNRDLSFFKGVEKTNDEYGETINPENHFFNKIVINCLLRMEPRIATPRWPPAQQSSEFEVSVGARTHPRPIH